MLWEEHPWPSLKAAHTASHTRRRAPKPQHQSSRSSKALTFLAVFLFPIALQIRQAAKVV